MMAADTPMDRERCLFLLSLDMDGRPVDTGELQAARAFAARDEECRQMLATWGTIREVLAQEPPLVAGEGFTDRVLTAAGSREVAALIPFVRRLALAAGVALALTVGYQAVRPGALQAGDTIETQRHHADGFKRAPFAADDLAAGLEHLLPFHSRRGASR